MCLFSQLLVVIGAYALRQKQTGIWMGDSLKEGVLIALLQI